MYSTPRAKRMETQTTINSSNWSRISKKVTFDTNPESPRKSILVRSGSNKSEENLKSIGKLSIEIRKKKVESPNKSCLSPLLLSPNKNSANIISKMSSEKHEKIVAYGVSTFKGHRNVINPHHLGINLGKVQNIIISESYDGSFAARIIKEEFPVDLMSLSERNKGTKMDVVIEEAYRSVQNKIMKNQINSQDNSGSSLTSVIIKDDLVLVANAGPGEVFCLTKNNSLLKLSEAHTAQNMSECNRIIDNGGHIYQTVVNVQYQDDLQVEGPMRISPSGITYTRTLGRAYDFKKQGTKANESMPIQFPLMWKPELKYVKAEDILWLGIFSEGVIDCVGIETVKEIIRKEINKKSESFTEHNVCYEASRKILDVALKKGVIDAMSSIISLFSEVAGAYENPVISAGKDTNLKPRGDIELKNKSISLTYVGGRKSFVKEAGSYVKGSLEKWSREKSLKKSVKLNISCRITKTD